MEKLNKLETTRQEYVSHHGEAELFDLTNSRFDRAGISLPETIYQMIFDAWRKAPHYQPSGSGSVTVRRILSQGYGTSADNVIVTAGSSISYLLLFQFLRDHPHHLRPGRSRRQKRRPVVLLPRPGYPLFESIAADVGIDTAWYHCLPEDQFLPDLDMIRDAITGADRERDVCALVLISPNNPTGVILPPAVVQEIEALCYAGGVLLIIDEVFSTFLPVRRRSMIDPPPISVTDTERLSVSDSPSPLTVRINGLSKMYAAPELKLGWIIITGGSEVDRATLFATLDTRHDTYLTVSGYAESAVGVLFETSEGRDLRRDIADAVTTRHSVFDSTIATIPVIESVYSDVEIGGIHRVYRIDPVFASHRFGTLDDEEIACRIIAETGVLIHPGYLYGLDGSVFGGGPWFVMTVLHEEETVLRANLRLRDVFNG